MVEHGTTEQHGNVDEHGEERVMPPKVSSRPEAATLFPGPSRQASAARGDGRGSESASESASDLYSFLLRQPAFHGAMAVGLPVGV